MAKLFLELILLLVGTAEEEEDDDDVDSNDEFVHPTASMAIAMNAAKTNGAAVATRSRPQ